MKESYVMAAALSYNETDAFREVCFSFVVKVQLLLPLGDPLPGGIGLSLRERFKVIEVH